MYIMYAKPALCRYDLSHSVVECFRSAQQSTKKTFSAVFALHYHTAQYEAYLPCLIQQHTNHSKLQDVSVTDIIFSICVLCLSTCISVLEHAYAIRGPMYHCVTVGCCGCVEGVVC